jgi:hypothetical protein
LSIAKHYETGEVLPEDIYAKLVAAKNFRAGSFSLRQVCWLGHSCIPTLSLLCFTNKPGKCVSLAKMPGLFELGP